MRLGVLQLDTLGRQLVPSSRRIWNFLAGVAVQTSIAIENARFHEWAVRQKLVERDLELAHEVQQADPAPRAALHRRLYLL